MSNIIHLDRSQFKKTLWQRALDRLYKKYGTISDCSDPKIIHDINIQGVLYIVKANTRMRSEKLREISYDNLELLFEAKMGWLDALKGLTYEEFIRIFPIEKSFDGAKYQSKDYFTTIDYINEHGGMGHKIEHPFEMLMDYNNFELSLFLVEIMSIMSEMNRKKKGKGLLEEFFESQQ